MAKKPLDDTREPVDVITPDDTVVTADVDMTVIRLCLSGVLHKTIDGKLTWRAGHLEHIANLYAGDPVTTTRNYSDDIAVAQALTADVWETLTK